MADTPARPAGGGRSATRPASAAPPDSRTFPTTVVPRRSFTSTLRGPSPAATATPARVKGANPGAVTLTVHSPSGTPSMRKRPPVGWPPETDSVPRHAAAKKVHTGFPVPPSTTVPSRIPAGGESSTGRVRTISPAPVATPGSTVRSILGAMNPPCGPPPTLRYR